MVQGKGTGSGFLGMMGVTNSMITLSWDVHRIIPSAPFKRTLLERDDRRVVGSSKAGAMIAPYERLIRLFGEPETGVYDDTYRIRAVWWVENLIEDSDFYGEVLEIYDMDMLDVVLDDVDVWRVDCRRMGNFEQLKLFVEEGIVEY